jgi:glyoxylase-like metal-dependent hydrolase (beta-lactamase superfamily II)
MAACFLACAALHAQQPSQAPAQAQRPAGRGAQAGPPPIVQEADIKKLTPHVWYIPDHSVQGVPNVGIVVGERATLVVDPGLGIRNGQAVLRAVGKLTKNTEMYVFTTHYHAEHITGVAAFPASAKYIVSQAEQKDIDELAPDFAKRFAGTSPTAGDLLKDATFRKPDITFDKTYDLDLGGVKIHLMAFGPTHTRGDCAAWVVDGEEGVIFAGDIALKHTFLAYSQYSSTRAWMDALVALSKLKPASEANDAIIVPSHGPIGDPNMFFEQRSFLQSVQARVRQYKDEGKSEQEIMQSVTDEMKERYKPAGWEAPNRITAIVTNIYKEMQ